MSGCAVDRLESFLEGELDVAEADALRLHLPVCPVCTHELEWLRAEQRLMSLRRQETRKVSPRLWEGVQQRIAAGTRPVRRWFTSRTRWLELGATFAVLVLMVLPLVWGANASRWTRERGDPAVGMCLLSDRASDRTTDPDSGTSSDEGPACVLPRPAQISWAFSVARHFSTP